SSRKGVAIHQSCMFPLLGLYAIFLNDDQNCKGVSGEDIDILWNLSNIRERTPQWHVFYMPSLHAELEGEGGKGGKERFANTHGDPDDSDGSMPSIQTVSVPRMILTS